MATENTLKRLAEWTMNEASGGNPLVNCPEELDRLAIEARGILEADEADNEKLRGALRGMLNLYSRMSGIACAQSVVSEVREAIKLL